MGVIDPTLSMSIVPVNVGEIIRCTTLALRRRRELLGPLCPQDPGMQKLLAIAAKPMAAPGTWLENYADLERALIQGNDGQTKVSADLLQRALLVGGQFDHPLTSTAFLELGHIALYSGDLGTAATMFEEASYSAFDFGDIGVIEEALRYGQLVHFLTNQQAVYRPLDRALAWAKTKGYRQLQASLAIMVGENFAILGQTAPALNMVGEARGVVGRRAMASGEIGGRLNYLAALVNYQKGLVKPGDEALGAAIEYKRNASRWLFQLARTDQRVASGSQISPRQASSNYEVLLRDPAAPDWAVDPLDCLTVLMTPHPEPYERWFEMTMDRKDVDAALDIAEKARRHRFFSSLQGGGRLMALRWILEAPEDLLDQPARVQRQDLLSRYGGYAAASKQAREIRDELAGKPLVPESQEAQRKYSDALSTLAKASQTQEAALREIGVRREASEFLFPPLQKTKDLRATLPDGQLILTFFSTANKTYGFLLSNQKYASWNVANPGDVQARLIALLHELGNYDANKELTLQDLSGESWKKPARELYESLMSDSGVNLGDSINELVIVPDALLWYVPFEILQVGGKDGKDAQNLLSLTRIRYAPTLGLAVAGQNLTRKAPAVDPVVVGKLFPRDDAAVAQTAFDQLKRAVPQSTALKAPLPGPSAIYRVMFDNLTVLDDLATGDKGPYDWAPVQLDRIKGVNNSLSMWMTLPWGGPEYVLLPGFHTPAENGLKKIGNEVPGNEMFLALCGLMSTGTKTVLISRWRTGGQTAFDLVREFAQELPNTTAADAWQRSVQVLSEQTIVPEQEPRVKRNVTIPSPKAQHPFFWSGYMLVDVGLPAPNGKEPNAKDPAAAQNQATQDPAAQVK
jgi:hypothetical protein